MIKPNLAAPFDPETIDFDKYQYVADYKYDGIRALIIDGQVKSRNLKDIPNQYIQEELSRPIFNCLDGELIVGSPTSPTVFRETSSAVRRAEGQPNFTFYVFDSFKNPTADYLTRSLHLIDTAAIVSADDVTPLSFCWPVPIHSFEELDAFEGRAIEQGYEGVMIRRVDRPYKFGRSSNKITDQGLMKLKRVSSSEAIILEVECEYENTNEATINELGYTSRSSHLANRRPKEQVGRLRVADRYTGVEFYVGIFRGYTKDQLEMWWHFRDRLPGKVITYDFFGVGGYDKPRHPVMKGFRDHFDLET